MALPEQDLLVERPDFLPDSRLVPGSAGVKGAVWRGDQFWQPIFCASCGTKGGLVPENNMTFAFWLCNGCYATYGHLTTMMVMPDEVFWAEVKAEQLEAYGRLLSNEELTAIVAADASPLATLIKSGRSRSTGG